MKYWIWNLARNKTFNSKSFFLKKIAKSEKCRCHWVKWTKTWFFESKHYFTIWQVEKCLFQNLKRWVFFNSKSNAWYSFDTKIWTAVFFLIQNLISNCVFRFVLIYHMCYQNQRTICWKMTTTCAKRFFISVWHVSVSHLVLFFHLLRSLWQLVSWWLRWLFHLHYQLICRNLFGDQRMVSSQRIHLERC